MLIFCLFTFTLFRCCVIAQDVITEPPQRLWVIHENGTRVATANAGSNTSRNIGPYYVGDTIHLFCVAFGGKPQPSLSWWSEQRLLKNTTTPLSEQRVRGDLRFGPLSREHHGRVFTCFAKNNDRTSPLCIDISIEMFLPPELVTIRVGSEKSDSVFSGRANSGDVLTLQCRVLGARPLPTVIWRLDDSQLLNLEQNITMEPSQQLMVNEIQLSITAEYDESRITCCVPAYRRDSEEYVCAIGQHLTVLYPPTLHIAVADTLENNTLSVIKGSNVSMNCSFEANPSVFQLIWFHEESILSHTTDQTMVSLHPSLELTAVSESDAGEYVCAATNDEGSSYSEPIIIDVVYPPYCEDESVVEYGVVAEDTINITCKVKANPEPSSYRWLLVSEMEGTKLHSNQSYTVETEGDTLVYQRPNCTTTLIYCWGLNSVKNSDLPQTKCTFMVTDETIPQPPSNCVAVKNVQRDITVTCEPGHDGGLPQKFMFTVKSLDSEEQILSIINQEPTFMIQEPKEDYKFVLVAINDKGESKVMEILKDDIVDDSIDASNTISAVTNITTLALALCGGVALLALAACGLVLCAHERSERADLPRDRRDPPLCAYNTDESNCETYNDSEDGSDCNLRRTESFRRAMGKYTPKNYDVRRTSSFHSARYLHDIADHEPKRVDSRHTGCRVHSLQNISRKKEMDVLCDHLVMHLPPETNYNVPKPMNTFYTMPRKTRNRLQKEISDETSEITQASDGFSLPPPPDEFGTYRAASRIKDIPIKSTPTYTTIIRQNSGKNLNKYANTISPINTVGLPSISGHQSSLYTYPDDDHQVTKNPFDDEH
ncbi:nephrin-like isoform X4 [Colias croceus]|uniref:nephrin-like isoform X4 n=1 Tax=Colias crocea TaxID=72248 RepID=UPI001E27EC8B|nr:nephrin-like isoform X4 [Colias croceus]